MIGAMRNRNLLAVAISLATAAILFAAEPASQPAKSETKENGLQITYVAPGHAGAKDGDSVSVLYTGKLADGTVFDSSAKHGGDPIEFILGQAMVIKGWDQGVAGMQVGEKRVLLIPPSLGYGEAGAGSVIPPNATLTFEVQLVALRMPAQTAGQ